MDGGDGGPVEVGEALELEGKTLILTNGNNTNVYRSARNLQGVEVLPFGSESVYDVLWAHTVVIELDALDAAKAAPVKKAEKEEPKAEAAVEEVAAEEDAPTKEAAATEVVEAVADEAEDAPESADEATSDEEEEE